MWDNLAAIVLVISRVWCWGVCTDCRFIVFAAAGVRHQILSTSKLSALRGQYHGIAFSADTCSTVQCVWYPVGGEGGVIVVARAEVVCLFLRNRCYFL